MQLKKVFILLYQKKYSFSLYLKKIWVGIKKKSPSLTPQTYVTVHRTKVLQKMKNLNYLLPPSSVFARQNILRDFLGVPDFFSTLLIIDYLKY